MLSLHILVVGFNHRQADIGFREKFVFSGDRLPEALFTLRNMKSVLECVLVSTCNRTEIYLVCDQLHTGEYYSKLFLEDWFGIPKEEFADYIHIKSNEEAVGHLFRVTCGLDSIIIGETQILGQIKRAFATAQSQMCTGAIFNKLFNQAIVLGKKVHTKTEVGQNSVSIGYTAVDLAKRIFKSLKNKQILLLGAGEMGELTAKNLVAAGATDLHILNRSYDRANGLAMKFHGTAWSAHHLGDLLEEVDIIISSTGATDPIITREMMLDVLPNRETNLLIIDIAVPRDIEPSVGDLKGVYLYNIDDLREVINTNIMLRQQEARDIDEWVEVELTRFYHWLNTLGVVPVITALRNKYVEVQQQAMVKIERKLPDLTEQQKRILNKQTKSIINQLLRDPLIGIKELASTVDKDEDLNVAVRILGLENSLSEVAPEKELEEVP